MYDAGVRLTWFGCVMLAIAAAALAPRPAAADARLDRALAEQVCTAQDPRCDWLATLSSLERASVLRAIAKRGYEVEPSPWGKVIGKVHIFNEDVFAEKSRLLQFFNYFHVTTQEYAIREELVIGVDEVWDQARVEETARRLRDPLWSSVVVVLPVTSADPTKVDMFVVTRDVWSLRLNTKYTFQQSKLTDLQLALSENNFLGTRNVLALALDMDQGSIAMGPLFIDKNVAGSHVELRARVDTIINRDALFPQRFGSFSGGDWQTEGSQSSVAVSKPLWSLASRWGTGVTFSHRFAIDRRFRGTDLRPLRCPVGEECLTSISSTPGPGVFDPATTPAEELLPWEYSMRRYGTSVYAARQFGGPTLKHQLTIAQSVASIRPDLLDTFPGTVDQREAFRRAALPRSEFTSELSVGYGFFTPRYRTLRNVQSFDLAEDVRFGPDFDVSYAVGLEALGSDANYQRASASIGWSFPWCRDGFVRPAFSIGGRYQQLPELASSFIDNTASVGARIVTPTYKYARVVAQVLGATRWNRSQPSFFFLGSDDGLRGFSINEFAGQRLLRGNFEIRSVPTPLWALRVGAVVFYDIGSVTDSFRDIALHQDVGFGFRLLIPQTSRELFRFDLAVPLDGTESTRAFYPKFQASFEQAF